MYVLKEKEENKICIYIYTYTYIHAQIHIYIYIWEFLFCSCAQIGFRLSAHMETNVGWQTEFKHVNCPSSKQNRNCHLYIWIYTYIYEYLYINLKKNYDIWLLPPWAVFCLTSLASTGPSSGITEVPDDWSKTVAAILGTVCIPRVGSVQKKEEEEKEEGGRSRSRRPTADSQGFLLLLLQKAAFVVSHRRRPLSTPARPD